MQSIVTKIYEKFDKIREKFIPFSWILTKFEFFFNLMRLIFLNENLLQTVGALNLKSNY